MPPKKEPQQWQSSFGQDEVVSVGSIDNASWTDEDLKPNVVGVIVINEVTEGMKVSLDGGSTYVTMLRAVKSGSEFDFQDRLPLAVRGLNKISFQSLTSAGPHTITLIKRYET
jgi:hypothetical protein